MKKTTNFDAFAQFADARLSKEEMKMIKGGFAPEEFEGGNPSGGGSGTGGGEVPFVRCTDIKTGSKVEASWNISKTKVYLDSTGADITNDPRYSCPKD